MPKNNKKKRHQLEDIVSKYPPAVREWRQEFSNRFGQHSITLFDRVMKNYLGKKIITGVAYGFMESAVYGGACCKELCNIKELADSLIKPQVASVVNYYPRDADYLIAILGGITQRDDPQALEIIITFLEKHKGKVDLQSLSSFYLDIAAFGPRESYAERIAQQLKTYERERA